MGFEVVVHDSLFNKKTKDENWLPRVGAKNWRVLTADQDMESLHHEDIVRANAGVFILSDIAQGDTYRKWVEMISSCEQQLRHACCRSKRPFVGRISRLGVLWRIHRLKPHKRVEDITIETQNDAATFGIQPPAI
jgi:PIN like domain